MIYLMGVWGGRMLLIGLFDVCVCIYVVVGRRLTHATDRSTCAQTPKQAAQAAEAAQQVGKAAQLEEDLAKKTGEKQARSFLLNIYSVFML